MIALVLALAGVVALCLIAIFLLLNFVSHEPTPLKPHERYYLDIHTEKLIHFPALEDPAKYVLTLLIPAYNETERLPIMLEAALEHLEQRLKKQKDFTYEVLIVDDGSTDDTTQCAYEFAKKWEKKHNKTFDDKQRAFHVLSCMLNRGKGGAVTQGMTCTGGKFILMADADGATDANDISNLLDRCIELYDSGEQGKSLLLLGSRAHLVQTDAVVKRSLLRNILMYGFHTVVYLLSSSGVRKIKDTQCGFKLCTREAVAKIFPYMHVEGWIFDIEMLHLASQKNVYMEEIQVTWHEVPGSKLNIIQASLQMALDLLVIRLNYMLGRWSLG